MVAAISVGLQSGRPAVPLEPVVVTELREVRVARRWVGDIADHVVDLGLVGAGPGRVKMGDHGSRVDEVAPVEVMVVIDSIAELLVGILRVTSRRSFMGAVGDDATPGRVVHEAASSDTGGIVIEPRVEVRLHGGQDAVARAGVADLIGDKCEAGSTRNLLTKEVGFTGVEVVSLKILLGSKRRRDGREFVAIDIIWRIPGNRTERIGHRKRITDSGF